MRRGSPRLLSRRNPLPLKIRHNLLQRESAEFRAIPYRHRVGRISWYDKHSRFDDRFDHIIMHRLRVAPVSRIGQSRRPRSARRGSPTRPSAPGIPGTVWHTAQPVLVRISVIGSSLVTSGTMSGTTAATDETGTGVTEEELVERRANHVPRSNAITMRGVINRSVMEPVAGKVRQGRDARNQHSWLSLAIYCIANIRQPASG